MGVPAFYRWLHDSFPKCVTDFREAPATYDDGEWPANPNGVEFDNVYLDFNQIVHQATHPPDRPAPAGLSQKLRAVLKAFDRLVLAARPRKLLVLALDGVAPRAKMNQQRARRYLAAQGRAEEADSQAKLASTWGAEGPVEHWDHNAITPGTEFMHEVARALRSHLARRVATSSAMARLTILLSDASTPGEGEHKIASIIREQRQHPDYDPDTTHLLYGLDADLVMIGLATHERRFYILRDWVPLGRERFLEVCDVCGAEGHTARACSVLSAARAFQSPQQREAELKALRDAIPAKPLLLLSLPTLREYLLHALRPDALGKPATPEAAAVHAEEAKQAAAAKDEEVAKEAAADGPCLPAAALEGPAARHEASLGDAWWDAERIVDDFVFITFLVGNDFLPPLPLLSIATGGLDLALDLYRRHRRGLGGYLLDAGTVAVMPFGRLLALVASEEARAIRGKLGKAQELAQKGGGSKLSDVEKAALLAAAESPAAWRALEDEIRFGPSRVASSGFHRTLCADYVQALSWCALYYYQGCPDWSFFFPYHYAPFAFDVAQQIRDWTPSPWSAAPPLPPLTQLIAVLPPLSAHLLPQSYASLVLADGSCDALSSSSEVRHLFPEKVELDYRGKKHAWQAVVLLPFIPIGELCAAIAPLRLTDSEQARNGTSAPLAFASADSSLGRAAPAGAEDGGDGGSGNGDGGGADAGY